MAEHKVTEEGLTMESKTESNTMNYINEIRQLLWGPAARGVRVEGLYKSKFADSYHYFHTSSEMEGIIIRIIINKSELYSYKKHLRLVGIPKFVESYMGVSTFEKHIEKQYCSYVFVMQGGVIHKIDIFVRNDNRKLIVIESYAIVPKDFWILSSYDFTEHLKIEMSNFSIEKQLEIIRDMNEQKHRKIEIQQSQFQEQSNIITSLQEQVESLRFEREEQNKLIQSIISSMQNQLEDHSELISSLLNQKSGSEQKHIFESDSEDDEHKNKLRNTVGFGEEKSGSEKKHIFESDSEDDEHKNKLRNTGEEKSGSEQKHIFESDSEDDEHKNRLRNTVGFGSEQNSDDEFGLKHLGILEPKLPLKPRRQKRVPHPPPLPHPRQLQMQLEIESDSEDDQHKNRLEVLKKIRLLGEL